MIIERLDLIAFGKFTNCSLDLSATPNRFHIVYGPNESGKSTSLRAIESLLFGMPPTSPDNYIHEYSAMRVGGRLVDSHTGAVIECVRRRVKKDPLCDLSKQPIDPSKLQAFLHGVDQETFSRQFGISREELVNGGKEILGGKGDVGEILFSAGAGLSHLRQARARLEEQRKAIITERSTTMSLNKLLTDWTKLKTELQEVAVRPALFKSRQDELERARASAADAGQRLKERKSHLRKLLAVRDAAPLFVERKQNLTLLAPVQSAKLLDESFGSRRQELLHKIDSNSDRRKQISVEMEHLEKELAAICVDQRWLTEEVAIDRLNRHVVQQEQSVLEANAIAAKHQAAIIRIGELLESLGSKTTEQESLDGQKDRTDQLESLRLSSSARTEIASLANAWSGVSQRRLDADSHVQRLLNIKRKVQSALQSAAKPSSFAVLDEALRSVGNPQKILNDQSLIRSRIDSLREKANQLLNRLNGFNGSLEQATALRLPNPSILNAAEKKLQQAIDDASLCERSVRELTAELVQLEQRLNEDEVLAQLPSLEQIDKVRQERDRLLDQLVEHVSEPRLVPARLAIDIRDKTRDVDRFHTHLLDHHDRVLQYKQWAIERDKVRVKIESKRKQVAQENANVEDAKEQWQSLWRTIGVDVASPEETREWLIDHRALMQAAQDLGEQCGALALADSEISRAVRQLQIAIAHAGEATTASVQSQQDLPLNKSRKAIAPDDKLLFDLVEDEASADDVTELLSLCTIATSKREIAESNQREFQSLIQQLEHAERELEVARSNQVAAISASDQWESQWLAAIKPLSVVGDVTPTSVDSLLQTVEQITALRRDVNDFGRTRQRHIESQAAFEASVVEVASRCGVTSVEQRDFNNIIDLVGWMQKSVSEQREKQSKRQFLQSQLNKLTSELASANSESESLLQQLQSLCREADCESIDQLPDRERSSTTRRELERVVSDIEGTLLVLAGAQSLSEFEAESKNCNVESIDIEAKAISEEIDLLEILYEEGLRSVGKWEEEVRRMDDSPKASLLLQDQQDLQARIRREANQFARLTIAQDVLDQAIAHYQGQSEGPVLDRAKVHFSQMSCQQYSALEVDLDDSDKAVLYAITKQEKKRVPANRLSIGTADALYLSMRIASLENHLDTHPSIPFILDDCLVQFDDDRAVAALHILSKLSRKTQVILFTHHQHLVQLATEHLEAGHFHLHDLVELTASNA